MSRHFQFLINRLVEFGKKSLPEGFHAKPAFFRGDLYFDALITEIFQICLVIGQALGEH